MKILRQLTHSDGFSILEVLVAATVSSIVLMMIYTAHRSIMFSVRDMAGIAEFYENVNLASRRIDRDIQCAVTDPENKKLFLTGENGLGDPYKGKLNFVTTMKSNIMVSGSITDPVHASDIKEVSYYLKEDPNFPGVYFLMRREANMYDDKQEEGGHSSILLENVADIRFEFGVMTTSNWDSKWDSETKNGYPVAVKTTLTVKNYRGKTETFSFISLIDRER